MAVFVQKNTPHDIPDEVEEVLGKRAILKLRKNKYNIDHPNSSISVMQYMICDDLLGDFEQVASDGDDDDDPSGSKVIKVLCLLIIIRFQWPAMHVPGYFTLSLNTDMCFIPAPNRKR